MYESYFGLSAKPFQLSPDPAFYFGSRGHRRAMAYLEYGLHQGEGFIVITGEVGAGKTTLAQSLVSKLSADQIVPVQIVSTQLDADDTLRLVATAFGLEQANRPKSELLQMFEQVLMEIHQRGRRALLIVDEAQNLTPRAVEELRMLSNFQVGTRSLLQTFLIGQPEFRAIMQRPEMRQLKQRIIASYHLGPLDSNEVQQYIEHRLRLVGWSGNPRFEADAYEAIHAQTDGVPRRINTLADRVMLAAYLSEKSNIEREDVDSAAAELAEELGSSALAGSLTPLVDLRPNAQLGGLTEGAVDQELQRLGRALVSGSVEDRMTQIEDRVALLEASINMVYGMLKKVLRILKPQETEIKP